MIEGKKKVSVSGEKEDTETDGNSGVPTQERSRDVNMSEMKRGKKWKKGPGI